MRRFYINGKTYGIRQHKDTYRIYFGGHFYPKKWQRMNGDEYETLSGASYALLILSGASQ